MPGNLQFGDNDDGNFAQISRYLSIPKGSMVKAAHCNIIVNSAASTVNAVTGRLGNCRAGI